MSAACSAREPSSCEFVALVEVLKEFSHACGICVGSGTPVNVVDEIAILKDVESIVKGLADSSGDLRRLNSSMLTAENTDLIKQSIFTLIYTLKNIESISSDVSGFTSDEATRKDIKLLIKSLSRLLRICDGLVLEIRTDI